MTDPSSDTATTTDHADKYNDPRARITRRGILWGLAVVLLGIVGAISSIYARRTRLEKTTEFWGPETILALQLAEIIELDAGLGESRKTVILSGMPGLGHLRRALLDERNFLWETEQDAPISEVCASAEARCVVLRLTDPTAQRFDEIRIQIDLNSGSMGPAQGSKRVQANERVRPALRHFLDTVMTYDQQRYDER